MEKYVLFVAHIKTVIVDSNVERYKTFVDAMEAFNSKCAECAASFDFGYSVTLIDAENNSIVRQCILKNGETGSNLLII